MLSDLLNKTKDYIMCSKKRKRKNSDERRISDITSSYTKGEDTDGNDHCKNFLKKKLNYESSSDSEIEREEKEEKRIKNKALDKQTKEFRYKTAYKKLTKEDEFMMSYIRKNQGSNLKSKINEETGRQSEIRKNQILEPNFNDFITLNHNPYPDLINDKNDYHLNMINENKRNKNNIFNTPQIRFKHTNSLCENEINFTHANKFHNYFRNEQFKTINFLGRNQKEDHSYINYEDINCTKKLNFSNHKTAAIVPLCKKEKYKKRLADINLSFTKSCHKNFEKTKNLNKLNINGFNEGSEIDRQELALNIFDNLERFSKLKCDSRNFPMIEPALIDNLIKRIESESKDVLEILNKTFINIGEDKYKFQSNKICTRDTFKIFHEYISNKHENLPLKKKQLCNKVFFFDHSLWDSLDKLDYKSTFPSENILKLNLQDFDRILIPCFYRSKLSELTIDSDNNQMQQLKRSSMQEDKNEFYSFSTNLVLLSFNLEKRKIIIYGYDKIYKEYNNDEVEAKNLNYNSVLMSDNELINKIEIAKRFFDYYLTINSKKENSTTFDCPKKLILNKSSNKNICPLIPSEEIIPFDSEASSDDENQIKLRQWLLKCAFYRYSKNVVAENAKEILVNDSKKFKENKELNDNINIKNKLSEYPYRNNLVRKIEFLEDDIAGGSSEKLDTNKTDQTPNKNITNNSFLDINNINCQKEFTEKNTSFSQSTLISNINCIKRQNVHYPIDIDRDIDIIVVITDNEFEEENEEVNRITKDSNKTLNDNKNKDKNSVDNSCKINKQSSSDMQIKLIENEDYFKEEWDKEDINKETKLSEILLNESIKASENKSTGRLKVNKMEIIRGEDKLEDLHCKFLSSSCLDQVMESSLKSIYSKFDENSKKEKTEKEIIFELEEESHDNKPVSKPLKKQYRENKNNKSAKNRKQKSTSLYIGHHRKEKFWKQTNQKIIPNTNNLNNKTLSSLSSGMKTYDTINNAFNMNKNPCLEQLPSNKEENEIVITLNKKWQMFDQVLYLCRVMEFIFKKESVVFNDEDREYLIFYFAIEILKSKNLIRN